LIFIVIVIFEHCAATRTSGVRIHYWEMPASLASEFFFFVLYLNFFFFWCIAPYVGDFTFG
jgi:hypothetical protein